MCMTLIVEDNAIFRGSLKQILSRRFPTMSIHEAGDGREALLKVDEIVPDLIFMDIRLPGTNGLELTRNIKRDNRDVVVVILTSYDLPEYRDAAISSGANFFLTKGTATSDDIMAIVESVLPAPMAGVVVKPGSNGSTR
jgi:DNA-binding NarL/FixJ family response regulator